MEKEKFLREACPNHTDKSKWNKSELLYILDLYKENIYKESKKYEIDFGGNVLSLIEINNNKPNVIASMNGGGYSIPLDKITISEKEN